MYKPGRQREVNGGDMARDYSEVRARIRAVCAGEDDAVALMATVACELYHGFDDFDWVGFYRVTAPGLLKIGPYQGGHGCLVIPFARGVCGAAAREMRTQVVADVDAFPGHIACAASTRSEIVVPVSVRRAADRGARRGQRHAGRVRRGRRGGAGGDRQ